jgi:hypothetical protein
VFVNSRDNLTLPIHKIGAQLLQTSLLFRSFFNFNKQLTPKI